MSKLLNTKISVLPYGTLADKTKSDRFGDIISRIHKVYSIVNSWFELLAFLYLY